MSEKLIPGHGPKDCNVCFIGEAGGEDESNAGIPFVGASGKLLFNDIFKRTSIKRRVEELFIPGKGIEYIVDSNVYVTNVVPFFPGKDIFERRFYEDKSCKIPTKELLFHYARLEAELKDVTANVFVAVGRHSLKAMCGKDGITNWAGSVIESTLLPGKKVIPFIHPAHTLREWYYRTLSIFDAKRVAFQSTFPEIRRKERHFILHPSLNDLRLATEMFVNSEFVSFDIETKGGHIACVGFANSPDFGICVPFVANGSHYWPSAAEEKEAWALIHRILTNPRSKKIAQNSLFDMSHLAAHGIPVANLWMDTMLVQNILYPELEKSLAILTRLYTDQHYYKDTGRIALGLGKRKGADAKSWDYRQSDEALWHYNLLDATITYEVAMEQWKELMETRNRRLAA